MIILFELIISKANVHLWPKAPTLRGKLWSPAVGRGSLTCLLRMGGPIPRKRSRDILMGGWFPRTHQGCISCPEILHDYYLKYLVSCSSTKRFFTPPKKMMAHQMAHQKAVLAIKRLFWPINSPSKGSSRHKIKWWPLPGTKIKWWIIKRLLPALMAVRLPSKRADLP